MIGRFAPSPTGPLHFGSLVAAVASYCESKSHQGQWLVRIEDVDVTRTVDGMSAQILDTLRLYGLQWDGEVVYQSQRSALYAEALSQLQARKLVYPCRCSRKEIADSSTRTGIEGFIYPGTCRQGLPSPAATAVAWRTRTPAQELCFTDSLQGTLCHQLASDIGDFVLKRADGIYSYQLAVVVDDALQGVSHVVRGTDLLHSTSRQRWLQQVLGYPYLQYAHIPVVLTAEGQKLSKQTLAQALPRDTVLPTLKAAVQFLGRHPTPAPDHLRTLAAFWDWAIATWQPYFGNRTSDPK